ncbi:MAG: peptidylprolyl isomerase [Sphingomonadaceae bacterium]|nr:peptidylprolyl isomerase [Sphingomonadaceae bacterium]
MNHRYAGRTTITLSLTLSALALGLSPALAQQTPPPAPSEIVAAAPTSDWLAISPDDILIMTLAPDAAGHARRIIIQLMPAPFASAWTHNVRTLARASWWDGLAIVRSQDNYVAQWGDPDGEDAAKARPLPTGLHPTTEAEYVTAAPGLGFTAAPVRDAYAERVGYVGGFPVAGDATSLWGVHCYGAVGVGRGMSPDAGTGAELYAVNGHAPRHLDRNIAVIGRVVEGMEHLSSLPRGTGPLGFYENPAERTTISSIRLASSLPAAQQPHFQYLGTNSASFARYMDARMNRRDPFFIRPAGGADICNIAVPVRRVPAAG